MTGVVALTGATGFVGRHVLRALLRDGFEVRALSRTPHAMRAPQEVDVCPGSLESLDDLRRLVRGTDAVLHCAGQLHGRDLEAFRRVNVLGTERLAEAAADAGVGRFLLVSSLSAREPDLSPYAASKRGGELALQAVAERRPDLAWEVVRPPVVYGPGDKATLLFFQQWQKGLALPPRRAACRFAMIYVEDLAAALSQFLTEPYQSGQIWDVHDGHRGGYSWDDVIAAAEVVFARKIYRLPLPKVLFHGAALMDSVLARMNGRDAILTSGKINELFHADWSCQNNLLDAVPGRPEAVRLQEGFENAVAWYKAQGWLK